MMLTQLMMLVLLNGVLVQLMKILLNEVLNRTCYTNLHIVDGSESVMLANTVHNP